MNKIFLILFLSCSKTNAPSTELIIPPVVLEQPILEQPILEQPKKTPTIHQSLVAAHNALRKSPLKPDAQLMSVAQNWTNHMAKTGILRHQSMNVIQGFNACGENIAMGQNSIEEVMESWMNSKGHRKNILNLQYTHIGVGYTVGKNGRKFWCVNFGGSKT